MKKKPFIIFGRRAPGGGDNVQLTAKDGQIAWTASREQRVRSLVRELVAYDAPPRSPGSPAPFTCPAPSSARAKRRSSWKPKTAPRSRLPF
ncbi:hypothetical protein [Sphingopyxis sp. BSNA05]|uniref:hypothetical protein n=1 Tax=Sphingopyxis sp. BSNA05 TaxID=1236614 RepID=UPI0015630FCE|nr:hypothetical protein [Sphingopyxis sp. BSNA05]